MRLLWLEEAWDDYLEWQMTDKKTLKRIHALLKDMQRSPYEGIGKPEALKENFSGFWSRRIDDKNRIVYVQENNTITIISCKGHYND